MRTAPMSLVDQASAVKEILGKYPTLCVVLSMASIGRYVQCFI